MKYMAHGRVISSPRDDGTLSCMCSILPLLTLTTAPNVWKGSRSDLSLTPLLQSNRKSSSNMIAERRFMAHYVTIEMCTTEKLELMKQVIYNLMTLLEHYTKPICGSPSKLGSASEGRKRI